MLEDYRLFVTQVVTLWAVLDPIGHLPLFLGATTGLDVDGRRKAAVLGVAFSFAILSVFAFAGPLLLHAMGISLLSFQIAGGIIVFLFAVPMVLSREEAATEGVPSQGSAASVAVHPLATPIIAGPGSMLTMVLLTNNNRHVLAEQAITIGALATVLSAMLLVFLLGEAVRRIIGSAGTNLMRRIMGLILAALAVNMILSALALWLRLPSI